MPKKRCALRIESTRQKIERHASAVRAQGLRIAHTGERMIIGDEIQRFTLGMQRNGWLHHAEIIADVQSTTRLNAGENTHGTN